MCLEAARFRQHSGRLIRRNASMLAVIRSCAWFIGRNDWDRTDSGQPSVDASVGLEHKIELGTYSDHASRLVRVCFNLGLR